MGKRVGIFELEVSDPSPVWIEIAVRDIWNVDQFIKFRAEDLDDLEHVVRSAKRATEVKSGVKK